jgi:hypothetical protein
MFAFLEVRRTAKNDLSSKTLGHPERCRVKSLHQTESKAPGSFFSAIFLTWFAAPPMVVQTFEIGKILKFARAYPSRLSLKELRLEHEQS